MNGILPAQPTSSVRKSPLEKLVDRAEFDVVKVADVSTIAAYVKAVVESEAKVACATVTLVEEGGTGPALGQSTLDSIYGSSARESWAIAAVIDAANRELGRATIVFRVTRVDDPWACPLCHMAFPVREGMEGATVYGWAEGPAGNPPITCRRGRALLRRGMRGRSQGHGALR